MNLVPVCLQEFEDDALFPETHLVNGWTCRPDWQDAPKRGAHQFRLVRQLCLVIPQAVWETFVWVFMWFPPHYIHHFLLPCFLQSQAVNPAVTCVPASADLHSLPRTWKPNKVWDMGPIFLSIFGNRWVFLLLQSVKHTVSSTETTAGKWSILVCFLKDSPRQHMHEISLMDIHFIKSLTKIYFFIKWPLFKIILVYLNSICGVLDMFFVYFSLKYSGIEYF